MEKNMEEELKDGIKDIQNAFWKIYKKFTEDKNMLEYNKSVYVLLEKYRNDEFLFHFCQNLIITWAPIVNRLKWNI